MKVTTTKHALEFVTELTLRSVSGYSVYSDVFAAINEHSTEHISLPDWADLMVIAPATANVLGKLSHSIADDALTTTFAAMRKPVVIAPAMNDKMYAAPATQEAITILSSREHITMLDCAEGELACGVIGKGRMQEVPYILEAVKEALTEKTLAGKTVLITAGPTKERIDPVRYLSNDSTGKMGYNLAAACRRHVKRRPEKETKVIDNRADNLRSFHAFARDAVPHFRYFVQCFVEFCFQYSRPCRDRAGNVVENNRGGFFQLIKIGGH